MDSNKTKNVLAVETATPVCSIALQTKDGRVTEKRIEGRGVHSEKTFLFIEELTVRAGIQVDELDAVLFSNGPGSYTGLRIGAAAIKGLLFRKDVQFYTFPTLLAFAAGQLKEGVNTTIHSVIDARREHLYWQQLQDFGKKATDPTIIEIAKLETIINKEDRIVGTGWERLSAKVQNDLHITGMEGISAVNLIKAFSNENLYKQFKKGNVDTFEPNYLTMSQINNSSISG